MARFQSLDELESQFSQLESLMHTVPIYKSACMHDRYSALQKCTDENKDNVKACETQRNSFQQELSKRNTDCAQKLFVTAQTECNGDLSALLKCMSRSDNSFESCFTEFEKFNACLKTRIPKA